MNLNRYVEKLCVLIEFVLAILPLSTAEICHAKWCEDHIDLWNQSLFTNGVPHFIWAWISLAWVWIIARHRIISRKRQNTFFDKAPSTFLVIGKLEDLQLAVIVYITVLSVFISTNVLPMCIYSAPISFTCVSISVRMTSFCTTEEQETRIARQ